jgi:CDP-diacylglycerol--glycerol-3-phosphate 3-phosphatidyltransferase
MFDFKDFNIADWFSFYRIAAAPFLLAVLYFDQRLLFAILILASYSTDAIDGFLARRLKISSARGSQLDSLGDQITFVISFIGCLIFEYQFIADHYLPIVILFMLNIAQQLIAFKKYGKATAFHTYLAKFAAVLQAIFVLWLLFFEPLLWLFYVLVVAAIIEALEEISLIFMYKDWVAGVRGIFWARKDPRRK